MVFSARKNKWTDGVEHQFPICDDFSPKNKNQSKHLAYYYDRKIRFQEEKEERKRWRGNREILDQD
jgi:hypothetical protein